MSRNLQQLKERIARTPVNRRGHRQYGQKLRRDIKGHAVNRLAQGASHKQIAEELGLAAATLLNWCKTAPVKPQKRPMGFRPVEVRDERSARTSSETSDIRRPEPVSRPVVVLPSGVRVEGISLTELPGFLGWLGCR
jgi:transposase-like protein